MHLIDTNYYYIIKLVFPIFYTHLCYIYIYTQPKHGRIGTQIRYECKRYYNTTKITIFRIIL